MTTVLPSPADPAPVPTPKRTTTSGPALVHPGDPDWDGARSAWLAALDQRPAVVARPKSAEEVCTAVLLAARRRLRVAAQGTGHGAAPLPSLHRAMLVRTSALDQVVIDPLAQTAWVGAGATWQQVSQAAAMYGLAAQAGSAADVGVAGYLLSGGISWIGRKHGLAVNDVLSVQIVTADGVLRTVDHTRGTELFWALRGGGGSFGVVTSFLLRLHPLAEVAAGTLFFPIEQSGELLHAWNRWVRELPESTMSCARFLQLPPLPTMPSAVSGRALFAVEVVQQGSQAELDRVLAPVRRYRPILDTMNRMPAVRLSDLHLDPPGPTPCLGHGMLLDDLPSSAVDALVSAAGLGSGSPLLSVELRHLGGAFARRPAGAGAVGHFDAGFVTYGVGVTPEPNTTTRVAGHLAMIERTLSPYAADVQYANFDEHESADRDRFHDPTTARRLRQIKAVVDPDNLFLSAHPVRAGLPSEQQV